jgi:hypothetical protein
MVGNVVGIYRSMETMVGWKEFHTKSAMRKR